MTENYVSIQIPHRFIIDAYDGRVTAVWLKGCKANVGDKFRMIYNTVLRGTLSATFEVIGIEPMPLSVFCREHYNEAGFENDYDAYEHFAKSHICCCDEYTCTEGFLHEFRRVK